MFLFVFILVVFSVHLLQACGSSNQECNFLAGSLSCGSVNLEGFFVFFSVRCVMLGDVTG